MKISLTDITLDNRFREDLGDIQRLAESLAEFGLIEPIVINQSKKLVAGGRRLAAARLLGWTEIEAVIYETLDDARHREIELEENIRRKDMDWKERVLAIREIHRLKSRQAALDSQQWGMRETGEMFNMSKTNTNDLIQVANELDRAGSQVRTATNVSDAIRIMLKQREEEATKLLIQHVIQSDPLGEAADGGVRTSGLDPLANPPQPGEHTIVPISRMLFHGDCLEVMAAMNPESIDHIITDPPYGIDMDNLAQQGTGMANIDSVRAEHDVESNINMLAKFFPIAYRVLADKGFLVLWYDMDHHEKLQFFATHAGFKVQRWPLVWIKEHTCLNQSAQYNFTKTIEVAMVCRKGNATLVSPQPTCHFAASNEVNRKIMGHPFVKPFEIWKWIFKAVALQGQTILDPFAGVGSCPTTALNCGYVPMGIESNESHYNQLVVNITKMYELFTRNNVKFT